MGRNARLALIEFVRALAIEAARSDHAAAVSENPEWTKEDFKKARPASELSQEILKAFPRTRGPQENR
ncbi:hypothetical protein [Methylocystis parvus]|uniref:Uncharacterized protein n=1 Tax=Methylocystis parvus TaxID=134 RepID=A0A6B8M5U8_9HYPH|nr:hypothetical protein [Methylocystis parvus]QGM97796.1 hypothetical protein F7D14_10170 [Methylocystis parvus]WBK01896.1 hypothetical protein MMG94_09410 [Methylocystis parvus OBBP]